MEQLLAIWVEPLALEQPDGSTLRDTLVLLDALSVLCPFTEVVRLGLYVLPLRGPSRQPISSTESTSYSCDHPRAPVTVPRVG